MARFALGLLLGVLAVGAPTLAQNPQSPEIESSSSSRRPPSRRPFPIGDFEQFAPYWTAEPGWRTELQMRNNLAGEDLTVTPILRDRDGTEFPLAPITIAPNEIKSVDVEESIPKQAPQLAGSYGSVVFRYRSHGMRNLYAAVMVFDNGHPIAFHMDAFAEATDYDAGSREGIWWLPNATAKDYLILANKSRQPLQTTLRLFDARGKSSAQQIILKPKTTIRSSVRQLIQVAGLGGSYGGFKIEVKSKVGSLDTAYLLFDETAGFSALMKTFDRNPQAKIEQRLGFPEVRTWTTRAPMLALANPDPALGFPRGTVLRPEIFVRNTTAAPTTALLRFNWRTDTHDGSSAGRTLQLAPYETRLIDVAALQNGSVFPADARWASVELTSSSRPNDLMATAASYDRTLRYGTQTPFNDQLTFHWEGGEWQVDSTHNSIITAGNGGSIPIKAQLTLYYDGGKKHYDLEQPLRPHEQIWLDVGRQIRGRIPDKNGQVLPIDLHMGSYELRDLTDGGVGNLFEGKVIVDKTFGHVAYGCATCCGFMPSPWMYYDPINVALGYGSNQDIWDTDNCTATNISVLGYMLHTSWDTGDHTIATASEAVITGVAAGSTTDSASGTLIIGAQNALRCPQDPVNPNGSTNVVSAIVSQRVSGTVSSDDAALGAYRAAEGTINLGAIIGTGTEGNGCFIGNEAVGTITPSTYTGTIVMHRWILSYASYKDSTETESGSNEDDTSPPAFQDDDPQSGGSGGRIYDLDAPGLTSEPEDGNTYRFRGNFYAYAALPDGTRISPYYNYYVRVSCKNTGSGYQFDNSLSGDNQIGAGTTLTTWNFQ